MAGAGFKTFVDGDILTAAEVNTYLMQQSVMVFASSAARTTAIAAPSEGMLTYLADTNAVEKYDGSNWVNVNDNTDAILKTIVDAKGDLIAGTAADTVSRLAIGTDGQVLTADSSTATGIKWAAVSSGSLTLVATASPSAASAVSFNSVFTSTYRNYWIIIDVVGTTDGQINMNYRASGTDNTTANYSTQTLFISGNTATAARNSDANSARIGTTNVRRQISNLVIFGPQLSQITQHQVNYIDSYTTTSSPRVTLEYGNFDLTDSFDGVTFTASAGTITGSIQIYGMGL